MFNRKCFFNSIVFNSMWNPSFHNWNIIKMSDLKTSPLHLEQDKTTKKPRCFRHFGTTERKKILTFPLVIQNQLFSYSKIQVFLFRNCSCFRVLSFFFLPPYSDKTLPIICLLVWNYSSLSSLLCKTQQKQMSPVLTRCFPVSFPSCITTSHFLLLISHFQKINSAPARPSTTLKPEW